MKNINHSRRSQYNTMFFMLKLLSLFFCSSPLFQYFFKDSSGSSLQTLNIAVFIICILIFSMIIFMWLMLDSSREKKTVGVIFEITLFIVICIASVYFSGLEKSYYKFLFMFVVVSYTMEFGTKIGLIVSIVSSAILFSIDLFMWDSSSVNIYFQTDIALCSMFAVTAWILGSYVNNSSQHIEELTDYANIDGLTEVYNHRYFQEILKQKCSESITKNAPLSLVMLDIDYFKLYNDIFGHQKGDYVLKMLGTILKECVSDKDYVCRYGGEEFTVILYDVDKEKAVRTGEKIRKKVEDFEFEGQDLLPSCTLTVSVGIATFNGPDDSTVDLIQRADTALYRAKFFRRNRVEQYVSVFGPSTPLDTSVASLRSFINVIHSRDAYTYNHVERVVWYCTLYADYMQLDEENRKNLFYGAYLHDLGKINVSKSILISTGKLSDEEWAEMKRHPSDSAEMIKRINGLEQIVDIVKQHHERYDGKGYPNGLTGEEIHPLARVLTVADCFDAMTSNRPYQRSRTYQDAFTEIKRCSGSQFDPVICENFILALQSKLF